MLVGLGSCMIIDDVTSWEWSGTRHDDCLTSFFFFLTLIGYTIYPHIHILKMDNL